MLDWGTLAQTSNAVVGQDSLNVTMLQGHLDMSYLAIRGHSFGGSTAIVVVGLTRDSNAVLRKIHGGNPWNRYHRVQVSLHVVTTNEQDFKLKQTS